MSTTSLFGINLQSENVRTPSKPTLIDRVTSWLLTPMHSDDSSDSSLHSEKTNHYFGGHFIGSPSSHCVTQSTASKPPPTEMTRIRPLPVFTERGDTLSAIPDVWMIIGASGMKRVSPQVPVDDTIMIDTSKSAVKCSQYGLRRRNVNRDEMHCFGPNRFGRMGH